MLPHSSIANNNAITSGSLLIAKEFAEDGWLFREFAEEDLDDVCALCRAAFPLDYPIDWYKEVVNGRYLSFGLYHNAALTSLLIAEWKGIRECDPEDQTLCKDPKATVVYILSLAVSEHYRRKGLATVLLKHLMSIVNNFRPLPRLIYLHVLCENLPAISFYSKNGFRHHATLPGYYFIQGHHRAGFTFVRHLTSTPLGEFLTSIYDACNSLFDFLATPFRRCINQPTQKQSSDPRDRLFSI